MAPKTIITGVTDEGKKFRPSDWAERVSGNLMTFKGHRMYYSPLLQPSVSKCGNKCVLVDHDLKESNPQMYDYIMNFAKEHKLKLCNDDEIGEV